jgi:hypothetical protein
MSGRIFYVGAQNGNKFTGFVPAKFLMRNGSYVMDPTLGGSQNAYLYSDGMGNNKTHGAAANPNNYLIVPANYDEQQARDFAGRIAEVAGQAYPGDETGTAGLHQALGRMTGAFWQGGSQDLQRNPHWGIPEGSTVPAFVGSASNHLGYVTGLAGLPMRWSEIGGGVRNGVNAVGQRLINLFSGESKNIDTGGPYWLSRQNEANIAQGFSDGLAANGSPSPYNDYGHSARPGSNTSQIGDGNGSAGWTSSLAGVDPQEPTPPAWPPQDSQPIRYLSSRRVQQ